MILIGTKIKGFRFDGDPIINFTFEMEKYIGLEGIVIRDFGNAVLVEFEDGETWTYPKKDLEIK